MSETTQETPEETWKGQWTPGECRCWHCGFVPQSWRDAEDHFGTTDFTVSACKARVDDRTLEAVIEAVREEDDDEQALVMVRHLIRGTGCEEAAVRHLLLLAAPASPETQGVTIGGEFIAPEVAERLAAAGAAQPVGEERLTEPCGCYWYLEEFEDESEGRIFRSFSPVRVPCDRHHRESWAKVGVVLDPAEPPSPGERTPGADG